jgi:hypothetical protein
MDHKEEKKAANSYWANETGLTVGPGDIVGPVPDNKGTLRWVVVTLDPITKKIVFRWGKVVERTK